MKANNSKETKLQQQVREYRDIVSRQNNRPVKDQPDGGREAIDILKGMNKDLK